MNNLEIDRKLAETMGIKVIQSDESNLWITDDYENGDLIDIWSPSTRIEDAWLVAERFGLTSLIKSPEGRWLAAYGSETARGQSAPRAICKSALKVIENQEGSKSDE